MAGRAGPRRKVTVSAKIVVEFNATTWRDLDVSREDSAEELFQRIATNPLVFMEDRKVISFERQGVKGTKEVS